MAGPQRGDRVSEYVLLEQIGTGSFGQVWKARHHIWADQLVAIKIPTDLQYVRSLRREGVAIHGLRHPNIVRAIGLDPYADPPYLVMELVDGLSLQKLIEQHPKGLPINAALAIFRGMLLALSEAHRHGLIHRDIKPANVLVQTSGELGQIRPEDVKVTDFGLGRAQHVTTASIVRSGSMKTEQGKSISGTLAYMAPEQLDGGQPDARSDLYSAGIVLFEMLTGTRPEGGELPGQLRPGVPAWVDEIFSRCYTRKDRRYGSAEEVLSALDAGPRSALPPLPQARPPSA
ncbi:MAG: serine/threonine-protein kinase, partial [Phycisphaerae bacterium]